MKFLNYKCFIEKTHRHFDRSVPNGREAEKSIQKAYGGASPTLQMMIKQKIKLRNTQYATYLERNRKVRDTSKKGVALLVVLFIIMAITILSLGFLSRSDVELACGQNMILRTQMDYLAESGLEHAKGLVQNPQDIPLDELDPDYGYWVGCSSVRLDPSSNDLYEVSVTFDTSDLNDRCNYFIDCTAYREKTVDQEITRVGQSTLSAVLRLDPCIALSVGQSTTLWNTVTVYGDVNCVGTLTNQGNIYGDVFASNPPGSITGITGQQKTRQELLLSWPSITFADFASRYSYGNLSGQTFGPYDPPQICYSSSSLTLTGSVSIYGMLLVDGDLTVSDTNNVIVAGKNLPALYVTGDLMLESNAALDVNGLAVVDGDVFIRPDNTKLNVLGGLFISGQMAQITRDSSVNGNTGTLYGPSRIVDGGHTALKFDGDNDYVQTPDSSTLQIENDYTISVWIKPNAIQNIWAGIVSKTDPSGLINHWTLQFDTSAQKKVIIYHPTGSWDTKIKLSDVADAWHHIGVVRKVDTMSSYLDGNPIHSNTWNIGPGSGDGHLNIGADRMTSSNYVYKGLVDDVRVYNRALDPNEIIALPDDSLIGHWKFDETNPNVSITAAPAKTAILVGPQDAQQRWGQTGGAFFRSIQRK